MVNVRTWPAKVASLIGGRPTPGPKHEGFLGFLQDNLIVSMALVLGLALSVGVIPYTVFLSHQTYECPEWAYDCTVFTRKLGIVQGIVTLIFTIGLTCLAYSCWALAEISIWPVLCLQPLKFRQIDAYLAVSRGSVPSILTALAMSERHTTVLFIGWTFIATLTTLSAGPVIGYVLDQPSLPSTYAAELFVGGGHGTLWTQTNPPLAFDTASAGLYSLWTSGFINESMSAFDDWLVDRETLASRGNFTAKAVRVQKSVSCGGFSLNQTTGPSLGQSIDAKHQLYFNTSMATTLNPYRGYSRWSSNVVAVANTPKVSVWAHETTFVSVNRTRTKLVFALPGRHLEGSLITNLTGLPSKVYPFISAVACDVDVELIDDTLVVGYDDRVQASSRPQQTQLPVLSAVEELKTPKSAGEHPELANGHHELALLISVAPILCGGSVTGEQPLFTLYRNYSTSMTPSNAGESDPSYPWTRNQIMGTINLSMSAVMMSTSWTYHDRRFLMDFTIIANRMSPRRNAVLAVPVGILVSTLLILAYWSSKLHQRCDMPYMKMCETADIIQACQIGESKDPNWDPAGDLQDVRFRCRTTRDGSPYFKSDATTFEQDDKA